MGGAFDIGGHAVGAGARCFVIAEAGVNHNGDVELARQLVDTAVESGADAVKFQTWKTDKLVAPGAALADYQRETSDAPDQRELLGRLELGDDGFRAVAAHAHDHGIVFLSTPDEEDSADFLDELGVPAFKIGSGELTNLPFLRHVARKEKPIVLSTGMGRLVEVERAVAALHEEGADEIVLLHCVSAYPAPPEEQNLRAMQTLRDAFGLPVGFSDHTLGRDVAVAAVALGACVLEKHFTLSRDLEGPDHRASLEPRELAELVAAVRTVESALGSGRKEPMPSELATREVVRRRILAARPLSAGTVLGSGDLQLLRAASGLAAEELSEVVGRRVACDIAAGAPLTWDLLV